ncbi:hypothetical protein [Pseudonocardia xishanensis]|uniref:Uncharacterized protein n=1 Tax=Pseudonocardia xishanensis TaxID=630995 RepID=A0ABP8RR23_9PSEU
MELSIAGDVAAHRNAVHASIMSELDKRPRVDANGRPLSYDQQGETYRKAIAREAHEAAHGRP